jgi:hypothetical protein
MSIIIMLIPAIMLVVASYLSYNTIHHYMLIKNTPPQTIRSVSQGFAQLEGKAIDKKKVKTPISQVQCVAFRIEIFRYVKSGSGKDEKTRKDSIMDMTYAPPFMLKDETGSIIVDAPKDSMLFRFLQTGHTKRYVIRRGFLSSLKDIGAGSRGIAEMRRVSRDYAKSLRQYRKDNDYTIIESEISHFTQRIRKNLEAFDEPAESGHFRSTGTIYATEQAILPEERVLVMGTVESAEDGSRNIITSGKHEKTFLIAEGDETTVLRRFILPMIGSILFFAVSLFIMVVVAAGLRAFL